MDIAIRLAEESKCVSHSVACVVVKDNGIIATGVNGSQKGHTNCCDRFPNYNPTTDREAHHRWSNVHEIHAEKNALNRLTKEEAKDSIWYLTVESCIFCFKDLLAAGVSAIYFDDFYDKNNEYREEMVAEAKKAGVIFERF